MSRVVGRAQWGHWRRVGLEFWILLEPVVATSSRTCPSSTDRVDRVADLLSDEQRREAAAGDVNVLAMLMLVGSSGFAAVNFWIGTMSWIAVGLSIMSTLAWSLGLWRRSPVTTSFVKIGFGVSGLVAPVFGVLGIIAIATGFTWGWALLGGAIVYFAFSLLGLEIIERAHETGVIDRYSLD